MTDIIKWRESYETGIESMDNQHRKLISLINQLYIAIREKKSADIVGEVLDEMNLYAEKHLIEEETLLQDNSYPDFNDHKLMHEEYNDKVKKLLEASHGANETALQETYTFLRQWWMGHIVAEDQKYSTFLKSKGVD